MMSHLRLLGIILSLMFSFAFVTGCGGGGSFGPTVSWSGKVTLKGAEIPSGTEARIIVQSAGVEGQAGSSQAPIVNGSYSLNKVPQGKVYVRFSILEQKPSTNPEDAGRGIIESVDLTPKKWQKGVEFDADRNDSNKDFDLTK